MTYNTKSEKIWLKLPGLDLLAMWLYAFMNKWKFKKFVTGYKKAPTVISVDEFDPPAPKRPVLIYVLCTACDVISFNGLKVKLCHLTCTREKGLKPCKNEQDSAKEAIEKGKNQRKVDPQILTKLFFH